MAPSPLVEVHAVSRSDEIDPVADGQVRAVFDHRGLVIQGWAVGRMSPIAEIEIADRAGRVALAPVNMPRPDIATVLPDVSAAATAGFRVVLEPQGFGGSELSIHVLSSDGARALLATVGIEVSSPSRFHRLVHRTWRRSKRVSWLTHSISGEAEKVLFGQGGWLFLRHDSNDVIGQHTGRVKLGRRERRAWSHVLKQRVEKCGDAKWLCVVIPDKESVYPEHLPPEIRPSRRRPVHDFLDVSSQADAPVVYSLDCIEALKAEAELYPKTDTHWNHRGAYAAYRLVCRELSERGIGVDAVGEDSISWSEEEFPGDLGGKVYPTQLTSPMRRANLSEHRARLVFDNGIRNHGRVLIFERADSDGATCVVFGESFVENLLIFLKESFRRLVVVHTSMFVSEIVEEERPDVVLSFPLERFLVRVPDDSNALSELEAVAHRKEGQLPWRAGDSSRAVV
jgi:alginate O-acetyltransferase complex protein AlgJ